MQLTDRLSRHPLLAARVRFMMRDLLDLRHNRWQLTGAAASIDRLAVTKTRDEVRRIIAAEEAKPAGAQAQRAAAPRAAAPRPAGPVGILKGGRFTGGGVVSGAGPSNKGPASFGPRQAAAVVAAAAPGDWQVVGAGGKVVVPAPEAEVAASAAAEAPPAQVILEGEALRKRVNGMTEEWIVSRDASELQRSASEISQSPGAGAAFARLAFSRGPNEKQPWRDSVAAALLALTKTGFITAADIASTFAEYVPEYIEAVSDVPMMAKYQAQVRGWVNCHGCIWAGLLRGLVE